MRAWTHICVAKFPRNGWVFGAVDPKPRYVEPRLGRMRFQAFLAPFPDEPVAQSALAALGGTIMPVEMRSRTRGPTNAPR